MPVNDGRTTGSSKFTPHKLTPNEAFYKVYGSSRNFLTSELIERGVTPCHRYWYELSWGWGFEDRKTKLTPIMVGATIINRSTLKGEHQLSKSFHSDSDVKKEWDTPDSRKAIAEAKAKAVTYINDLPKEDSDEQ